MLAIACSHFTQYPAIKVQENEHLCENTQQGRLFRSLQYAETLLHLCLYSERMLYRFQLDELFYLCLFFTLMAARIVERIKRKGFGKNVSLPNRVTILSFDWRARRKDANLTGEQTILSTTGRRNNRNVRAENKKKKIFRHVISGRLSHDIF
jgi:hypothetical protein